ncbi:MAG: hypothetical protein P1V20_26370 [Verrucomicrobiales bacterium]|nr:hypothetical protein [Verrucomicrobiales bacterium]
MSFNTPDGAEGASRSCDACKGATCVTICRKVQQKKQKGIFTETIFDLPLSLFGGHKIQVAGV